MKILQNLTSAAFLLAAFLFTACEKDKDPANKIIPVFPVKQKTCRLLKITNDDLSFQEFVYDNNGKVIKVKYFDGFAYKQFFTYTYNAAGKVAEEILFTPDSIAITKKTYTYNANNLLTRINIYHSNGPGTSFSFRAYIRFQHNNAGQRVLSQEYMGQPDTLIRYTHYTYNQNVILAKRFIALTTPATLQYWEELYFDNKKSIYSNLGYLDEYYPEIEKHNIITRRFEYYSDGNIQTSSTNYQYDSLDYPIRSSNINNVSWLSFTNYEYDCN